MDDFIITPNITPVFSQPNADYWCAARADVSAGLFKRWWWWRV